MTEIVPYVYVALNCATGEFYIGSRYANVRLMRTPEEDWWVKYRSSSKRLQSSICEFGDNVFITDIIFRHDDFETGNNDHTVFWYEQNLIKENSTNPLCLNDHYLEESDNAKKYCTAGMPKSAEHKIKIGSSQRGIPKSAESIEKFSAKMTGRKLSDEHRHSIKLGITGIKRSTETKEKMRLTKLGCKRIDLAGTMWYNDGRKSYQLKENDPRRLHLKKGRVKWK